MNTLINRIGLMCAYRAIFQRNIFAIKLKLYVLYFLDHSFEFLSSRSSFVAANQFSRAINITCMNLEQSTHGKVHIFVERKVDVD